MEEIRLVSQGKEGRKASLKSALLQYFRSPGFHQKKYQSKNNVLMKAHTIARVNGINVISQSTQEDDKVVRMNIIVRDEDLEHILEYIRNTNTTTTNNNNNDKNNSTDNGVDDYEEVSATLSIEKRLNLLRKKLRRQNTWSPALQTIPEEISPN